MSRNEQKLFVFAQLASSVFPLVAIGPVGKKAIADCFLPNLGDKSDS